MSKLIYLSLDAHNDNFVVKHYDSDIHTYVQILSHTSPYFLFCEIAQKYNVSKIITNKKMLDIVFALHDNISVNYDNDGTFGQVICYPYKNIFIPTYQTYVQSDIDIKQFINQYNNRQFRNKHCCIVL